MSPSQEEERLRRLRERQLSDRDPLVHQRRVQRTTAVRTRKAIGAFSFKESLNAIPRVWVGAFVGLLLGLAVLLILPMLWPSPLALLVGILAAIIFMIFGVITGNAFDLRNNIKKDL